jgi:hypothetical protein
MTAFTHLRETLNQVDPDNYEYVSDLLKRYQLTGRLPSRNTTYYELKHGDEYSYQYVKTLLRGHLRSPAILAHFEKCGELQTAGSSEDDLLNIPPFRGWIVSGERWESFTIDGTLKLDLSDSSFNSDTFPLPSPTLVNSATPIEANKDQDGIVLERAGICDEDHTKHEWSCRVG